MIVFFSSCELVEFHYSLFLHTLLRHSRTPTSEQLPSASCPLKFLRLHGNMEQEVSSLFPTPHAMNLLARVLVHLCPFQALLAQDKKEKGKKL